MSSYTNSRPVKEGGWIILSIGEMIQGLLADVLGQSDPSLAEWPASPNTHVLILYLIQDQHMSSNTANPAVDEATRDYPTVQSVVSVLSQPKFKISRYLTKEFNEQAGKRIPRIAHSDEWLTRMRQRLGLDPDPEAISLYYNGLEKPSIYDLNVYAVEFSSDLSPYTLAQTLTVFPNAESFITAGAAIDLVSDRLVIIRSDMPESPARTALIDRLTRGSFSPEAMSSCPRVEQGSKLSERNLSRLARLKNTMAGTRYLRFANPDPIHGPSRAGTGIVYNLSEFSQLIHAQATVDAVPVDTIEYSFLNDDRLECYQRISRRHLPDVCHGNTTVLVTSPEHAPDYFDLLADDTFPGQLKNMKHLRVDVSIGAVPDSVPNRAWTYWSPHLQSVTFRVHDRSTDYRGSKDGNQIQAIRDEADDARSLPTPEDLAKPLYGLGTTITYIPAPQNDHLSVFCDAATLAAGAHRPV
jgi:hypothetical protein